MIKVRKKDQANAEQNRNAGFVNWSRADKSFYDAEMRYDGN